MQQHKITAVYIDASAQIRQEHLFSDVEPIRMGIADVAPMLAAPVTVLAVYAGHQKAVLGLLEDLS